ncbi:hypothetical protein TNIN_4141 [Trichonephila inaurata madagascariensis]|uniref:Uncharacterized protein n=1 Tax=Trichonephila inaurata madagascariensis TaxID=2747483 RepID=A0A8X7CLD5_9ARAC|nr:hypothetical protein TNIN_4141 [Trichonephila inaurata madagascariensis]
MKSLQQDYSKQLPVAPSSSNLNLSVFASPIRKGRECFPHFEQHPVSLAVKTHVCHEKGEGLINFLSLRQCIIQGYDHTGGQFAACLNMFSALLQWAVKCALSRSETYWRNSLATVPDST